MHLRQRHRLPELMDQPGLDHAAHSHALRGLERINRWSGSSRILWPPIAHLAQKRLEQPLRMLDVATGAGDLPIQLWRRGQRANLAMKLDACDISDHALDHARAQAALVRADIHFFRLDVLQEPLPEGYDVVMCSLFLHHLDEEQARGLLQRMRQAARYLVLVNDLRRSLFGYALAYLGTRILSASHIVHVDGPLSVQAAFTIPEVRQLAKSAGMTEATVSRRWPCRFLLTWRRP